MKKIAKGFTLIELMIVVAIIGILAAIAIPNFVKYQLRSKFGEGTTNLEGLRKAEEALRQGERKITIGGALVPEYKPGQYWNLVGTGAAASPLPSLNCTTGPSTEKCVWDPTELATAAALDWQVEGATYFQYEVGITECALDTNFTSAGICFFAGGRSDIDGDQPGGGAYGEIALNRLALDGTTEVTTLPSTNTVTFPGTIGGCLDSNSKAIYSMPCVVTGPDVF